MQECASKAGVEVKDMQTTMIKMKTGEALDAALQKKVGCVFQCMSEKMGLWQGDGINVAAMEAKIPEIEMLNKITNVKEAIKECGAIKGADNCDTAFKLTKCLTDKGPSM